MEINKTNPVNINLPVDKSEENKAIKTEQKTSNVNSCDFSDSYGRVLLNRNTVSFGAKDKGEKEITESTEEKIYYDEDFGSEIRIIKHFDASGNCTVSRIEIEDADKTLTDTKKLKQRTAGKTVRTSNKNANRSYITEYDQTGDNIKSRTEIIYNEHGEPEFIVHSKTSDIFKGAFETTKYNLSDYPEDTDIIGEIKANRLNGGEILSKISVSGNTASLNEQFDNNGFTSTRFYSLKKDDNGKIVKTEYKYKIKGQDIDFETERSFTKNPDNTTTTTVDGKTYNTSFNDNDSIITVKDENGNETVIDFKKKLKILPSVFAEEFGGMLPPEKFYGFLKEQPGDVLLLFNKNVKKVIPIKNPINSGFFETSGILTCGANSSVMYHELGHSLDNENPECKISQNKELISIYEKEFKEFKNKYPKDYGTIIEYFASENEKGKQDGLSELVAETNLLLHTYGSDEEKMQSRAQLLVRHFPRTVATAAKLMQTRFKP